MREIIGSVSKLSFPTFLNLVSSIIKNKILALIAGPAGLGIYSQIMNLSAITSVLPIGSVGLLNYISSFYKNNQNEELASVVVYFFRHNFIFTVIITGIFLIFNAYVSHLIFASENFSNLIILFSLFIPFNLLLNFIDIYFKGIRVINKYVLFLSINTLVSTLVTIPLIFLWGITGAVFGMLFASVTSIINGFIILKRNNLLISFAKLKSANREIIRNIYMLGIGALTTIVLQNVTILIIKSMIATNMSLNDVGIFQSVYSISSAYFGIFFILIGSYSIPKVATLKENSELTNELNSTIKFLLLVYTPLIIVIFVFRTFLINLLFTNEFLDAKFLLIFQLPAEFIRALSWVMGLWLIPKIKVRQWMIFDITFCISFLTIFSVFFYNDFGVKSASIAYLIAYSLYFIINFIYSFKQIGFRFTALNTKSIIITCITLMIMFFIAQNNEIWGLYSVFPVLIIWGLISIKREDVSKILEIAKQKIKKN